MPKLRNEFVYDDTVTIAALSQYCTGQIDLELALVRSWKGETALELRRWDHRRGGCCESVYLTNAEAIRLKKALKRYYKNF